MADIEYSDHFAVFITENGVRYLTNQVSMEIMKMLSGSRKTLSEIASELDVAKSSIQANLNKLQKFGLVRSEMDKEDRRKTNYYTSSMMCMESVPVPDIDEYEAAIFKNLVEGNLSYDEMAMKLFSTIPLSLGVNMGPLIEKCGGLVARFMNDMFEGLKANEFVEVVMNACDKASFPERVIRHEGEDVIVEQPNDKHNSMELLMPNRILRGFICQIMMAWTGKPYHVEEISTLGDRIRYIFRQRQSEKSSCEDADIMKDMKDNWPYSIYYIEGKAMLFGNINQIRILDLLYSSEKTMRQISEELNIPVVTVHVNIVKLMDIGAVYADNDTRLKNTHYGLKATPVLVPLKNEGAKECMAEEIPSYSSNEPSDYYRCTLDHVSYALKSMGVEASTLLYRAGKVLADVILYRELDIDPETFIEKACEVKLGYDVDIETVSHIPLKIKVRGRGMGDVEYSNISNFYSGLLKSGLRKLTDADYNVDFIIEKA